jgi:pyruvate/2-oxoglutarate dehydrogenase complex dihydrolipoamide acyltransferase (E2) component
VEEERGDGRSDLGERPVFEEGRVVAREHLSVSVTFDHTVVDGAPATRFAARLKEVIEAGWSLPRS